MQAASKVAILFFTPFLVLFTVGFCSHSFAANSSASQVEETSDAAEKAPAANTTAEKDISVSPTDTTDPPKGAQKQNKTEDDDFDFLEETAEPEPSRVADPIAPFNKAMFYFNDKLYFWVLKPITRGYAAIFPEFARTGVANFFRNIYTPIRFVNSLLQGKGDAVDNELASFFINSTWGVLGFGAPAQNKLKIPLSNEDMGQTFGAYGIGNGFYIVWPFIGPSTLRDSVGRVGDRFLNPTSYVESTGTFFAIWAYDRVNETSFRIGEYEAIKEAAIDPYTAIRNGYIQFRNARIEE